MESVEEEEVESMEEEVELVEEEEVKSVEEEVANNTIVTAPSKHIGYCIHCGKEIEYTFGEEKPRYYCKDCWREWYHNGSNTKQKENYCHRCGKPHPSSVEKPLCWPNCWHEVTK